MSARFEELGWKQTPMGVFSLRRRFDPAVQADVFEVKLDDEHLMSSLFTVAERELARLALARTPGTDLDVVIGGLGLGYTALEALQCPRVRTLRVIEYSDAVIDWHQRDLLPDSVGLAAEDRVELVCADFFDAATNAVGFDPQRPGRTYDTILLDIDHSPRYVLHAPHAGFYTDQGLQSASSRLAPGGVFAMWSDDPPDDDFTSLLGSVFTNVAAESVWLTTRSPVAGRPPRSTSRPETASVNRRPRGSVKLLHSAGRCRHSGSARWGGVQPPTCPRSPTAGSADTAASRRSTGRNRRPSAGTWSAPPDAAGPGGAGGLGAVGVAGGNGGAGGSQGVLSLTGRGGSGGPGGAAGDGPAAGAGGAGGAGGGV